MKVSSTHLILLVVALLAIGTWAGAQGDQMQPDPTKQGTTPALSERFQPNILRATDLIGMKVVNRQNEDLGKVEEIVLNPERNQIAFGVLSFGGVMGLGEKHFAVPWATFEKKPGATALVIDKDKESLKNAPGFDKKNYPNMANPRWKENVEEFYSPGTTDRQGVRGTEEQTMAPGTETEPGLIAGQTPRAEPDTMATEPRDERRALLREKVQQAFESRKLSEIIGMSVNNPQGEDLGELEDVAIDMREGRPVFGIVALGDDKMAPVPWSSLNIQPQTMIAQLDADLKTLETIAFNEDSFPNLSSREYASNVYSRFNREPYWSVYGYVSPGETQRPTGVEPRTKGWGPGTEYSRKYNPNTVTTIQGTVHSVGFFVPERGAKPGERLRVRTDDGKPIIVHLGPRSHLQSLDVSFQKGDKITITGSQAEIGGRSVIIASQVKKGDQTIQLRDDQGKPMWEAQEMGKTNGAMPDQPSGAMPGQPKLDQPGL